MAFKVVIPARLNSTRLPRKPLKEIAGKPMVQWVVEAAQKSAADQVVVATDDASIIEVVESFGGLCCMTKSSHPSGTDRLQEVAAIFAWQEDQIIVNVQGDEPLIPAAVIDQVAKNLAAHPEAGAATLAEPISSRDDMFNPNAVKVVRDLNQFALYFSRAPIPYARDQFDAATDGLPEQFIARRHIGIYAYKVGLLNQFVRWSMSDLESFEKLEQLRILANGHKIHVADACMEVPGGVDTEADFERVSQLIGASHESV